MLSRLNPFPVPRPSMSPCTQTWDFSSSSLIKLGQACSNSAQSCGPAMRTKSTLRLRSASVWSPGSIVPGISRATTFRRRICWYTSFRDELRFPRHLAASKRLIPTNSIEARGFFSFASSMSRTALCKFDTPISRRRVGPEFQTAR